MALTPEQIDAEAFARWGEMKGGPLELCRGFARAIEAAARRDALEEAAKVCESQWSNAAEKLYGIECAAAIRKLKEDTK